MRLLIRVTVLTNGISDEGVDVYDRARDTPGSSSWQGMVYSEVRKDTFA